MKKGTLRLLSKTEKNTSGNCDSDRSDGTVVDNEKVNIQMYKYRCDHGRSVTLRSVDLKKNIEQKIVEIIIVRRIFNYIQML